MSNDLPSPPIKTSTIGTKRFQGYFDKKNLQRFYKKKSLEIPKKKSLEILKINLSDQFA
jgi:hypothetical protein